MQKVSTNNFNYVYKDTEYGYEYDCTNNLILELYRAKLYNKLKSKLLKIKYAYYITIKNIDTRRNKASDNKNKYLSDALAKDILGLLIFNHSFNSNYDPIFDNISPYTISNLSKQFIKEKKLATLKKKIIKDILIIYLQLSSKYIRYYNR